MDSLIKDIYAAFSTSPLTVAQKELYIDFNEVRGGANVVNTLASRIRLQSGATCQVLAGHDGSGKSTELYRLQGELESGEEKYFVVFCEAEKDIDRNDVDFPEVLIAIIRQMTEQLQQRVGITLQPGYFKDRLERLKDLLSSEVDFEKFELGAGLLKLSGVIKSSPDSRMAIRKLLEPDTSNLLGAANDLIGKAKLELSKKGYQGLVILVDDLDKMILRQHEGAECSTQEYLFIHRSAQLRAFNCHVIYTIPLELAYSHQEATIEQLYGRTPVIPMVKIFTPPPANDPYPAGIELFRQVIQKRLASANAHEFDLFQDENVRDELILLSGGQPTELMSLVRESIISYSLPITRNSLARARKEGRRTYARNFGPEHWAILEEVRQLGTLTRSIENEKAFRQLLESRAILLYINDEEWYGINPFAQDMKPPTDDCSVTFF